MNQASCRPPHLLLSHIHSVHSLILFLRLLLLSWYVFSPPQQNSDENLGIHDQSRKLLHLRVI